MPNPQTRIPPSMAQAKASQAAMTPPPDPVDPNTMGGGSLPTPPMPGAGGPDGLTADPGAGAPDMGQLIGQLAAIIQQQTGRPPTPQQLQAALQALMGGGGAPGGPPGLPAGAPPAMPPMGM